ncbi:MAG: MFS transporter [Anaerolineales bacterium]|nr:MAG: MFS transporter [Anaerolineales bacterium]
MRVFLGKSPLVFIFITIFVDLLGYGMMVPLLPFYVQNQQGGAAIAGSLGSLYALMQLLSGPVLGGLSDRYGRRPVLLISLLGTSFAYLLLGLADSLSGIYLAIMLDGITGGNLTTAYAYIADVTAPEERSRGMGLVGAAFGLGLMAGPVLGGLLSVYGLGVPAFTACAIALANVIFGFLILPESLPAERRNAGVSVNLFNSMTQLAGLFRLAPIRMLLLTIFTLNLAFSGLQTNFPLYSQRRFGWDATLNGIFFAYVGACAILVQGVIFRGLQPKFGEKRLSILGLGLMAAGLAGMAVAQQAWMLYPFVGLVALGSGISIPALTGLVSNQVSAGMQGRLMGGSQALLSLTTIIGPTLAGLSFEHIAIAAPYWLGSLLSAVALLLAYLSLRRIPVLVKRTVE